MLIRLAAILALTIQLAGCNTTETAMRPATLKDSSPETMQKVTSAIAAHLGQTRIVLGAGEPTRETAIAVLPPQPTPLEGHSLAMPEMFDILTDSKSCFLRSRKTGETFRVAGVTCRAKAG